MHRSKFGKSRLVPVHPSTASALAEYTLLRDQVTTRANTTTNAFFVTETGRRAYQQTIRHAFVRITKQVGMRGLRATSGPRLHDFRHTFAVNTLIHWYRRGLDAERALPKLSTYLGHRHWSDTYWYLTAVPELMCLVWPLVVEQNQALDTEHKNESQDEARRRRDKVEYSRVSQKKHDPPPSGRSYPSSRYPKRGTWPSVLELFSRFARSEIGSGCWRQRPTRWGTSCSGERRYGLRFSYPAPPGRVDLRG